MNWSLPDVSLGYTLNSLDRMNHRRGDAEWLTRVFDDARARLCLFAGETPILKRVGTVDPDRPPDATDPWFTREEAARFGPGEETIFLGLAGGAPRFGRLVPPFAKPDPNAYRIPEVKLDDPSLFVTDLRTIGMMGILAPSDMGPLAQAKATLHWHRTHRFCSRCGGRTEMAQSGWRRDCPACGGQHFPRTDPVVIMLAVDGDRCLLGRQRQFPPGMYSALAGFLEPGETIAGAVRREILEETAIETDEVKITLDQPWPFPASLMIGAMAQATSRAIVVDEDELEDARWFTREDCYGMLTKSHPARLFCPPPVAIAHHLIRAFVKGE